MISLNFKKYGEEGPVFIILHGLFGMLDNWQRFAKLLEKEGFQVYAVDQRDHGKSPKTDSFTYDHIANDIKDFCEQHEIQKAHFIGHSMGGKSLMRFSLLYPQYVLSQSIVDISPKEYQPGHNEIFDALASLDIVNLSSRNEATEKLSLKLPDPGVVQFLLKNLGRDKDNNFIWKMNLSLLKDSYDNIIGAVSDGNDLSYLPSLFVRAGNSNYILDNDLELIEKLFPNYSLETIENVGHWIHAENPELLLELILDFIN